MHSEDGWDEPDDLDGYLAERLEDPEVAAAFEDASARSGLLQACVERRRALGLTQTVIAERMSTTQSTVSEFESGGGDPRLSTFQRYARALDCRLDIQLCDGHQSSGWRGIGVDVLYTSHEHRVAWLRGVQDEALAAWNKLPHLWDVSLETDELSDLTVTEQRAAAG
jgi:transcriptional regulator with XRE-family HTH domain